MANNLKRGIHPIDDEAAVMNVKKRTKINIVNKYQSLVSTILDNIRPAFSPATYTNPYTFQTIGHLPLKTPACSNRYVVSNITQLSKAPYSLLTHLNKVCYGKSRLPGRTGARKSWNAIDRMLNEAFKDVFKPHTIPPGYLRQEPLSSKSRVPGTLFPMKIASKYVLVELLAIVAVTDATIDDGATDANDAALLVMRTMTTSITWFCGTPVFLPESTGFVVSVSGSTDTITKTTAKATAAATAKATAKTAVLEYKIKFPEPLGYINMAEGDIDASVTVDHFVQKLLSPVEIHIDLVKIITAYAYSVLLDSNDSIISHIRGMKSRN